MVLLSTLPRILGLLKTLYYKASAVICLIINVQKLVRKNDIFFLVSFFFFSWLSFFLPSVFHKLVSLYVQEGISLEN
jgi:hypothetical protein